jgi:hypothetical protein
MARRPPSAATIRSQIRSAEQKFQREMNSALRKAERDINRELASAQRKAEQDANNEARRLQRRLEAQARRSRPSAVRYTVTERQYLGEIHDTLVADDALAERDRDLFLCHAWADRHHAARELFDALIDHGVDAWFSEEDIDLGTNLPRQLDRGIRCSRIGLVLVTPAMLMALRHGGFADQELGALLSTNRVIPVLHDVTYADLRQESPLLAARAGLSTADSSLPEVAEKIADSVLATT